ncbi:MAG: hypothetical protein CMJ18_20935 [Phycisphaeraceae bacterium]|nr:hypothetical protein [Phycisphaeraceae bacterium]
MSNWNTVLELDSERRVTGGDPQALCDAVSRGGDLRIMTQFIYNEHIDPKSSDDSAVNEVSDFRVTYVIDGRWVAGIMNLRMPIANESDFGPRPSMSYFMYNQDGQQAIARLHLDGETPADHSVIAAEAFDSMPKNHIQAHLDADTNAPIVNFIWDFEVYRFIVCDNWEEVYAHTADGQTVRGSLQALREAFLEGREIKVGLRGICRDLAEPGTPAPDHEMFVHTGPGYDWVSQGLFSAGAQPTVRVRPTIPMVYASGGWDFGWLMPRTDGHVSRWLGNPYTLQFTKSEDRCDIRWFVR